MHPATAPYIVQFTFQGGEPTLGGLGFFRRFMELEAHYRPKGVGVEAIILCSVSSAVAKDPQRVYASLRALGDHPMRFIPCLDPMEARRAADNIP